MKKKKKKKTCSTTRLIQTVYKRDFCSHVFANPDRYICVPLMLFTSFPTHPHLHIISHNSLRERITFEIGVRGRSCFPWSVNFLDFFLAACKVFRKASLSLRSWRKKSHDLQSLPSSNMLPYLVSFWLNGWNTDLGLETERHYIESFDMGGDEFLASKSSF